MLKSTLETEVCPSKLRSFRQKTEPKQKTVDLYVRYEERKHYCFVYLETFNFHQLGGKNREI